MFGGATENGQHLVVPKRLLDVVERAFIDRLHRRLQRRLSGHQDHRNLGIERPRRAEDLDAADVRHPDVAQDDVGPEIGELFEGLLPAVRDDRRESFVLEQDAQRLEDPGLIIDHQDRGLRVRRHA